MAAADPASPPPAGRRPRPARTTDGGIRLNKLLASRGLGSRRACDALIEAGSVRVNGTVVREPGTRVEPGRDRVAVHGRAIPGPSALRHYVLHKPAGVLTTLDDPQGRPTLRALFPRGARLFPLGRLDADTSGLLVITNDGELAHHLMHPRYGVAKLYRARVDGVPDATQLKRLREGVELEPGVTSGSSEVRLRAVRGGRAILDIAVREGRNRQVRRMCEAVGLPVRTLHRWGYGPLRLGDLPPGAWRALSPKELAGLNAHGARALSPGVRAPGAGMPRRLLGQTARRRGRSRPVARRRNGASRKGRRAGPQGPKRPRG